MAYRPAPPPPPAPCVNNLCQQKLLPVYVFTYIAQYMKVMKVAGWHKGSGEDSLWPENQ